ncbi:10558_t:CDS:2, partial [Paraglomus occultum]
EKKDGLKNRWSRRGFYCSTVLTVFDCKECVTTMELVTLRENLQQLIRVVKCLEKKSNEGKIIHNEIYQFIMYLLPDISFIAPTCTHSDFCECKIVPKDDHVQVLHCQPLYIAIVLEELKYLITAETFAFKIFSSVEQQSLRTVDTSGNKSLSNSSKSRITGRFHHLDHLLKALIKVSGLFILTSREASPGKASPKEDQKASSPLLTVTIGNPCYSRKSMKR